jgi:hypothetical protein
MKNGINHVSTGAGFLPSTVLGEGSMRWYILTRKETLILILNWGPLCTPLLDG